jgi:hypothetical protein
MKMADEGGEQGRATKAGDVQDKEFARAGDLAFGCWGGV